MQPNEARTHVTVIGALFIGSGAFGVLIGLAVFFMFAGMVATSGDPDALALWGWLGAILGGAILFLSVPSIVGGIGLLQRRPWARTLGLVLGVLSLLSIPIGTLIGIYTIWALTRPEIEQFLAASARPA